jgi:hypothetical protein
MGIFIITPSQKKAQNPLIWEMVPGNPRPVTRAHVGVRGGRPSQIRPHCEVRYLRPPT